MLANIHQNANAALCLTPDECVNEVYLLMRVLVDTGITFSCLLVSDEAERKKYFEQSPASPYLKSSTPEQLLEQAKALAEVDAIPPHRMNSVRERIEILGLKLALTVMHGRSHQVITAWLKALGYVEKTGDPAADERMQKVDTEIEALLRRHQTEESNHNSTNQVF